MAELDLSFPPSWAPTPLSLILLEMRAEFGNRPAWGPSVGQEPRAPLWFCDNILRIKEGEKNIFEESQMLLRKMSGCNSWRLFKFLFGETFVFPSSPALRVKAVLKLTSESSHLHCQGCGETRTLQAAPRRGQNGAAFVEGSLVVGGGDP